ncbi:Cupin-2 domain-containing protein [Mycena sanguinolenta]|uniref:Cupin-2 domain-containing protein n=1 Tax=Mycena sanguinolenta TaxID=230812 RepID=A0A8H6TWI8_9AGAR|nr:Cupin-2 domain-containing protein [Mycena sanguinolenta]
MNTTPTQLADPRLVVTGHTSDGTSIFTFDDIRKPFMPFGPQGQSVTSFHTSPTVPASNTAPYPELGAVLPRCPPEGVIFCITDIQAGGSGASMHRTQSIDYAVVISGEIVLALDNGEEKTVKAGEFIVQRGTNRTWHNRSEAPCRIAVVMVGAEKIVLEDGKVLEKTVFGKTPE